jgi:hypothetical protein
LQEGVAMKTKRYTKSVLIVLIAAIITVSTSGCVRRNILIFKSERQKVIDVINANTEGGDAEAVLQEALKDTVKDSDIKLGKWKWHMTAVKKGVYVADYGYWGQYPWWKIILGGIVWIITAGVTGVLSKGSGWVGYNPWPLASNANAVYVPIKVYMSDNTIEILDRDPYLEEIDVDVDTE